MASLPKTGTRSTSPKSELMNLQTVGKIFFCHTTNPQIDLFHILCELGWITAEMFFVKRTMGYTLLDHEKIKL
jgi:hypothetical protein